MSHVERLPGTSRAPRERVESFRALRTRGVLRVFGSSSRISGRLAAGGIFINYRITTDDPERVGRVRVLHDLLREFFGEGQVFLDTRSIDMGAQSSPVVHSRLVNAQIVVAVVHPGWRDAPFTRLGEEGKDWVSFPR